jgi:hypothetical protein
VDADHDTVWRATTHDAGQDGYNPNPTKHIRILWRIPFRISHNDNMVHHSTIPSRDCDQSHPFGSNRTHLSPCLPPRFDVFSDQDCRVRGKDQMELFWLWMK